MLQWSCILPSRFGCFVKGKPNHEEVLFHANSPARNLDREGRAICRIVFAHGMGIQYIASVFCVAEDTVIQAIENKEVEDQEEPDNAENDYWYVSREFRELYPRSRHQVNISHSCTFFRM